MRFPIYNSKSGRSRLPFLAAAVFTAAVLPGIVLASFDEWDNPPIRYSASRPTDPVAQLQARIDRGEARLKYDPARGYLPAVLQELRVPVSSQMLVFTKTSFQRDRISPRSPRALYFNDQSYVGWVQGGPVLELATADPQLGAVFYVLDQEPTGKPQFVRQTDECLSCHGSSLTQGVPGFTVRSVFSARDGQPILSAGTFMTSDESPFKERWGGWYVTGTHGKQRHMGNITAGNAQEAANLDLDAGANVTDLRPLVSTAPYLTKHSDITALMVHEHQTRVQNLITKAGYQTRMALQYEQGLSKEFGLAPGKHLDSTFSRIRSVGEPLVRGLLFVKEAPLTDVVKGTSGFTEEFPRQGPRDSHNRSLREFDLKTRLFQYPCSYLVYSPAFEALPPLAKDYVYRRLREVLSGQDQSPEFTHLTAEDRKAILGILNETKAEFAAWKPAG